MGAADHWFAKVVGANVFVVAIESDTAAKLVRARVVFGTGVAVIAGDGVGREHATGRLVATICRANIFVITNNALAHADASGVAGVARRAHTAVVTDHAVDDKTSFALARFGRTNVEVALRDSCTDNCARRIWLTCPCFATPNTVAQIPVVHDHALQVVLATGIDGDLRTAVRRDIWRDILSDVGRNIRFRLNFSIRTDLLHGWDVGNLTSEIGRGDIGDRDVRAGVDGSYVLNNVGGDIAGNCIAQVHRAFDDGILTSGQYQDKSNGCTSEHRRLLTVHPFDPPPNLHHREHQRPPKQLFTGKRQRCCISCRAHRPSQ